jgi:hypothetical protein
MTRETKLGLLVASSFVALTAVVVVSRLKQVQTAPSVAPPPVRMENTPPGPGTKAADNPRPAEVVNAGWQSSLPPNPLDNGLNNVPNLESGPVPGQSAAGLAGGSGTPGGPPHPAMGENFSTTPPAVAPLPTPEGSQAANPPAFANGAGSVSAVGQAAQFPQVQSSGTAGGFDWFNAAVVSAQIPYQVAQLNPSQASPPALPVAPASPAAADAGGNEALKQAPAIPTPVPAGGLATPPNAPPANAVGTSAGGAGGLTPPAVPNSPRSAPPATTPGMTLPDAGSLGIKPAAVDVGKPAPAAGGSAVMPNQQLVNAGPNAPPPPAVVGGGNLGPGGLPPVVVPPPAPKPVEPAPTPGAPQANSGQPVGAVAPVPPSPPADNRADNWRDRMGKNVDVAQLSPGSGDSMGSARVTPVGTQEKVGAGSAGLPPVGAVPSAGSPPIPVPVPGATPRPAVSAEPTVKVYEEQIYTCKPEDATFEALSERLYKSKDYAQALLRFNREHPRGAPELQGASPQLRQGMQIYVPPREILEDRYPNAIPGLKSQQVPPGRESVSGSQSSPVAHSEPQPAPVAVTRPQTPVPVPTVAAPAPGQANSVPATSAAAGGKVYRVAAGGEQLFEIARRELGDGRLWTEIYRLNPSIVPGVIPAGTVLVMPDNARRGP